MELLPSSAEGCLRIVASSFNRIGTQFVRYDTGDLAIAATGSCTNHFLRVGAIAGRSRESFVDSSGRRRALGPYVFGIHGPFWDQLRDLQVVQDSAGTLRVRLVVNPDADRDQIQRILRRRLPMVRLVFEYVAVIERSLSGKRPYFVDSLQAVVTGGAPGNLDPGASFRKAPPLCRRRRWIATAGAVLAAVVLAMSFLIMGAGGNGSAATVRTHRTRGSIVTVRLPYHHRAAKLTATVRSPWILGGYPRVDV